MFSFFHLSSILLRIFLKRAKNRYFHDVFFTTILLNASSFLQKKSKFPFFNFKSGFLLVLSSLVLP
jgi:hypothetical protein